MTVSKWMHAGTILKMNAVNYPSKLGWQDKNREFTFSQWNERACRFANGLRRLGVGYGERVGAIAYNRGEWLDIYAGAAKGGQIVVPLLFRLAPADIGYIVNHSECQALIVEAPFVETIDKLKGELPVPGENYIYLGDGPTPAGYIGYEDWLAAASAEEPDYLVDANDPWVIMYTSGTTGKPKGVIRSHEANLSQYLVSNIAMGVRPTDKVMLVMPMSHVNSVFYSFAYTLVSAPVFVYNMVSFDPVDLLRTIERYRITFASLVPTHYVMILELPDEIKNSVDVSSMRQLLISSAPARRDLKLAIMDYFKNAELWEAYGSTESGIVTILPPEDQFRKLGSIGREIFGIDQIMLLDDNRNPVLDGEVGELYFRTPHVFNGYWKDAERTKAAFFGEWSSVGDMARKDQEGYYYLVDRKANMIITGGENVFPSEVEYALLTHPSVKDVAVIGVPDRKWGESIKAIVVLNEGYGAAPDLARQLIDHCQGQLASYKKPKSIDFIKDEEMPRTATGKILHRNLRDKYGKWSEV